MQSYINPTNEGIARFIRADWSGPLHMLNLIRLREKADYEDGRDASGAEAYSAYGKAVMPHLSRHGARLIWSAEPSMPLIGPDSEAWDIAFVVEYPSREAFLAMLQDPEYRKITHHRTAAVEDSRLIPMVPSEIG